MKEKAKYRSYYEKFMRLRLDRSIVEVAEYQPFSRRYPHLAESIRLRRELSRLEHRLKSEKHSASRLQIRRKMGVIKSKLRQIGILKRIHGESKQEAIFRKRAGINTLKSRITQALQGSSTRTRKAIRVELPPSLYELKSLERVETGQALKDWIHRRSKRHHR